MWLWNESSQRWQHLSLSSACMRLRGPATSGATGQKDTELFETVNACIYVGVAGTQWGNTSTNDGTLGTTGKFVRVLVGGLQCL